jgi:hypothetical protein
MPPRKPSMSQYFRPRYNASTRTNFSNWAIKDGRCPTVWPVMSARERWFHAHQTFVTELGHYWDIRHCFCLSSLSVLRLNSVAAIRKHHSKCPSVRRVLVLDLMSFINSKLNSCSYGEERTKNWRSLRKPVFGVLVDWQWWSETDVSELRPLRAFYSSPGGVMWTMDDDIDRG